MQRLLFIFGVVAVLFVIVATVALIGLLRTRPAQPGLIPLEDESVSEETGQPERPEGPETS